MLLFSVRSAFATLHKEKEQAAITLHSIADAVITTDTSLRILSLNPAAAKLTGVQFARVLGEPFHEQFEIVHPQTREKMNDLLEDCLQSGENPCHLRKQAILVRHGDGGEFQVEITVSPLPYNPAKLFGLVIVFHDVTATRVLEKQLKEKVLELVLIVKYAGVGIAFVRDGIVQEVNSIVSEIIGIPEKAIVGQRAEFILTSYLGYTEPIDQIYEQLSKGELFDIEHQMVRSDQKRIWLRLIGQVIDPHRLSEAGSVWIIQDITQLKQHQEVLRVARFHAEEASRFKSEFLAHANHELRNLIGGIIGLNRLVLETELTPVQQQYLTIVQNTAENLLLLINNLLDFSKIEAGVMELEEKPFRIDSVYDYVRNVVALRIEEKGLSLTLSISEGIPLELVGDELRLGQILLNLICNALKFTSTGGINVLCERITQTESTVQLRFNVTDTGCGIDEPAQKKIFDAFNQTIAKSLLEREAHWVKLAANGREALLALAEETFDVIFMDVQMPLMDGLTATRLIRRCEKEKNPLAREGKDLIEAVSSMIHGNHIPIIGMTGNSTEDGRLDCLKAGMDNNISKPFERKEMLCVLDVVCEEFSQ